MTHASRATTVQKQAKLGVGKGITFDRTYTTPEAHPYDEITWDKREATITNAAGEVVFSQKDVEVPSFWSQQATDVRKTMRKASG